MSQPQHAQRPGFKYDWTPGVGPKDPKAFFAALEAEWTKRPARGDGSKDAPYWALQVDGNNPISGYSITFNPAP